MLLPLLLLMLAAWPHRKAIAKRRKCPGTLSEDKIIRQVFTNYTKKLPDSDHPDESVHVQIEMHVQDMGSLNEITADFEIDILFTQLWHDPNLSFLNLSSECVRNITMESRYLKDIWTPNTCIINAKKTSVHASPTDNIMFILYENGTVWINHRLSVKAPCNLDLRTFPFDTQTCMLLFESYSHNSEEVTLHWMVEPITLMKQITLPDFDMIQFDTKRETLLYPNGYWDELQASFTFKRRYGFYILQAYVPTYLTIIVSWVGFCMEPKALPARTTVGVSSLLALTLQFGNIHKNLPRVSYVKAMDVWMLGCISFVFGTMIELAIVCYITRCQGTKNSRRRAALERRYQTLCSANRQRSMSAMMLDNTTVGEFTPADGLLPCTYGGGGGLSASRTSSMRLHTMPVPMMRNGGLPQQQQQQQRKISNQSSRDPPRPHSLFNRRLPAKARSSVIINGGNGAECASFLANEAGSGPSAMDRPSPLVGGGGDCHYNSHHQQHQHHPQPNAAPAAGIQNPQPVLPQHQQQQGNGDVIRRMPKSVSGHSNLMMGAAADQHSMSFLPDQLNSALLAPPPPATTFTRPLWTATGMSSRRRSTLDEGEENWPIIQPESIDKLSIVVFPLAFTLFNLIYWWYYLSMGGQFDPQSADAVDGIAVVSRAAVESTTTISSTGSTLDQIF